MSVTAAIAIIGSVTTSIGTLYGIWAAYDDRRKKGRSNIKVSVMEHAFVLVGDESKDYTVIKAANHGDHEVMISTAGATFLNDNGSMIYSPLTFQDGHEAKPHSTLPVFAPIQKDGEPKIAYYWVTTTLGEEFRAYVVSKWNVRFRNFLHRTHIHRKVDVKVGLKYGKNSKS
ncbi:MAG TPA: hypothetical protein VMR18_00555 [Candidatus Saccharimonadales bacterium]|nr:hypothetical protein [Candidatus Saccharimonadales bacterium]